MLNDFDWADTPYAIYFTSFQWLIGIPLACRPSPKPIQYLGAKAQTWCHQWQPLIIWELLGDANGLFTKPGNCTAGLRSENMSDICMYTYICLKKDHLVYTQTNSRLENSLFYIISYSIICKNDQLTHKICSEAHCRPCSAIPAMDVACCESAKDGILASNAWARKLLRLQFGSTVPKRML
jgi:hypothetical protein